MIVRKTKSLGIDWLIKWLSIAFMLLCKKFVDDFTAVLHLLGHLDETEACVIKVRAVKYATLRRKGPNIHTPLLHALSLLKERQPIVFLQKK